jgi:lipopolysaccharide/colanic/teichoic acid biosynthesis glycosyltransferase
MFDISRFDESVVFEEEPLWARTARPSAGFMAAKRAFDVGMSLLLLPILAVVAVLLLMLNPFFNEGRLFYTQRRMGRDCRPFTAIKFRSMRDVPEVQRSANCPLEVDRITPLGGFLRKSRIDELPQILNVLMGDMSLIGPRPDYYDHAVHFLEEISGYRERHAVRPGISGLAQTELGYVEGVEATRRKVSADLYYIAHAGFRLETWIFLRTLSVVARRAGA